MGRAGSVFAGTCVLCLRDAVFLVSVLGRDIGFGAIFFAGLFGRYRCDLVLIRRKYSGSSIDKDEGEVAMLQVLCRVGQVTEGLGGSDCGCLKATIIGLRDVCPSCFAAVRIVLPPQFSLRLQIF